MARSKKCVLCNKTAALHDGINDEHLCHDHFKERLTALGGRAPAQPIPKKIYTLLTLDSSYDQDKVVETFVSKESIRSNLAYRFSQKEIDELLSSGSLEWSSDDNEHNYPNMSLELFESDLV